MYPTTGVLGKEVLRKDGFRVGGVVDEPDDRPKTFDGAGVPSRFVESVP